jgi:hypothetical protein
LGCRMAQWLWENGVGFLLAKVGVFISQCTDIDSLSELIIETFELVRVFLRFKTNGWNLITLRPAVLTHSFK